MAAATWALPVGILSTLCVLMFIFMWWWFPRTFRKGIRADMDRVDEDRRVREMSAAQQREQEGNIELGMGKTTGDGSAVHPPPYQPAVAYHPPAYTSY
ncbi:hypothetical protein LTR37_006575 [Vermiconidia calcicola]|uniref:Uncharacterized protein n=1 Tax=Vermiconidia calcicola TaxID=1690605 RepID=A0ACC3NG38_9PEZI|nr:hypothetical protein LTR37_006575 [Vermiconidia calcicola]